MTETSKTFVDYRRANVGLADSGRQFRFDLDDGKEIIWMSERDGWKHLYLFDGVTGKVKNQITKGNWVVRGVEHVDEANTADLVRRRRHAARTGPVLHPVLPHQLRRQRADALTDGDGNHTVTFSPDDEYYVDTWSRVDLPPVIELRRTSDAKVICELEQADATALVQGGLARAGGVRRQGARRHDRHLRRHLPAHELRPAQEVSGDREHLRRAAGLVRAQDVRAVDSRCSRWPNWASSSCRSTAWAPPTAPRRSTTSCWKNLGDAGFPDRILWIKAAAAKYPWYDISRVGIYGGSAGGQNSLGALLSHRRFLQGRRRRLRLPRQPHGQDLVERAVDGLAGRTGSTRPASNVANAGKLQGKLLLIVGELDTNVDPASTHAGGQRPDQGRQGFRPAGHSRRGSPRGGGASAPYGDRKR